MQSVDHFVTLAANVFFVPAIVAVAVALPSSESPWFDTMRLP
jgi:hypothetical protein